MKLKKVSIFLVIVFFLNISVIKAAETPTIDDGYPSNDLKYDVEDMSIDGSGNLIIKGWARRQANLKGDHNIGDENLRIYIAAVKTSNFSDNVDEIITYLKSHRSNKTVNGKYVLIQSNSYTNGNLLFGSLCYKTGGMCQENPRSFIVSKPASTCTDSVGDPASTVTCESYNTGFNIEISLSDLKNKLISSGEDMAEVKLLIFITHRRGNVTYDNYTAKYDVSYIDEKRVYAKDLAVYSGVCSNCNSINKLIYNIDMSMSDIFKIQGTNYKVSDAANHYFEDNGEYKIIERDTEPAPNGNIIKTTLSGKQIGVSSQYGDMSRYKLKTKSGESIGGSTIYKPRTTSGDTPAYWAWSSWGTVTGETILTLFKDGEDAVSNCNGTDFEADCEDKVSFPYECTDVVSKVLYTPDDGLKLNSMCGNDAKITVKRKYNVIEQITLTPDYTDLDGNSYNLSSGEISIKNGRYFGFNLDITRDLTRNWEAGNKFYYTIEFVYDNSGSGGSSCDYSSPIPVTRTRLLKLIDSSTLNDIISIESGLSAIHGPWEFYEKSLNNINNINNIKRKNFFHSNVLEPNGKLKKYSQNSSETINLIDKHNYNSITSTTEIIEIGINKPCMDLSGKVTYVPRENACTTGKDLSLELGYVYFVPLEFPGAKVDSYIPRINMPLSNGSNNISYFKNVNYNFCKLMVDNNIKLKNKRYRVINIKTPFPHAQPGTAGKATNWYNLWIDSTKFDNGNKDYLYDRYINSVNKKSNSERYVVHLNPESIKKIRKFNYDLRKNNKEIYFGVNVEGAEVLNKLRLGNLSGISQFITHNLYYSASPDVDIGNIFDTKPETFSAVGEKGVDS